MPTPKPPQQVRAQRTRRQLLEAAQRVFADGGYEGATVDDIAEAAGCSKGAYYFHFASKEEALVALLDEWAAYWSDRLTQALDTRLPPAVALFTLLNALLSVEAEGGWEPQLVLEFWSHAERSAPARRRLLQAQRSWRRLLAKAIAQAQQAGALATDVRPEAAAATLLALRDGLLVQACVGAPPPGPGELRTAVLTALLGAGAESASASRRQARTG